MRIVKPKLYKVTFVYINDTNINIFTVSKTEATAVKNAKYHLVINLYISYIGCLGIDVKQIAAVDGLVIGWASEAL